MQHRFSQNIKIIHLIVDFLLLNLSFIGSYYFKFEEVGSLFSVPYSGLLFFINMAWFLSILAIKPYTISRASSTIPHILSKHFTSILLHACLVAVFFIIFRVYYYSREQLLVSYLILFIGASFWKGAFTYFLQQYRLQGYNNRKVVVVGYGEISEELKGFFQRHKEYGYKFLGYFASESQNNPEVIGTPDQIKNYAIRNEVDEIYCCLPYVEYDTIRDIIDFCERSGRKIKVVTDYRSFYSKGVSLERYDNIPVLNISSSPIEDSKAIAFKRAFDILFSLFVLVVGAPVFLITAAITKLSSKGPVFFIQERVGKGGKPFEMYKFRSMFTDSEQCGPQLACDDDPRVTPWGKFMRKSRLDEIPQFINVFQGDMSIVGPRPERQYYIDQIVEKAPQYRNLHYVKPGITSIGQIKFGYASNIDEMVKRLRYDLVYLRNVSLLVDLKIILLTIVVVFRAEGK
ncbi:MAG: sugar transferase [Cyclobacteriaceae bacterium]